VTIAAYDDVVGCVEALAFEAGCQDFELAIFQGTGYAALAELAGVEAAFGVVGVADDASGAFGVDGIA